MAAGGHRPRPRLRRRPIGHQANLNQRGQRKTRLEDTYAELFGSVQLLLRLSPGHQYSTDHAQQDEAWVRFGTAMACVLLQESDARRRQAVARLEEVIEELYRFTAYLDGDPTPEQRFRDSQEHLRKLQVVRDQVDLLLAMLRGERVKATAHERLAGATTTPMQVGGATPNPGLAASDAEPAQLPPVTPTTGKPS